MKIIMLQRVGQKLYAHIDPEITDYIAPHILIELRPKDWDKLSVHMVWKVNTEESGICLPVGFIPGIHNL